jgi:eukaryotic-like serine/threonine-protein kinase
MVGAPVRWGDILAGKYRVERVLGQGNMGIVVAATHIALGQLVAIKFLLANRSVGQEQLERFMREGRAAALLKSAHVTRVLDVGKLDDGMPYTVMEHLEGRDLKAILVEEGPLPIADAVEYVLQACEAIGEAHAAGVVHRDIKPANLFLTTDVSRMPCVKIFDFGISRLETELTLTQDTASMGSPLYMSPEQLNSSHDVDGRADLWSLGASLFELLAGQTPYHADTMQQLCYRIFSGHPTPLSRLRPEVPAGLEAVIMQCLEKDRNRRFNNIAELAAGLAPWAPARAAAYPERVARVLNVQTTPATGGTLVLPVRTEMASSPVTSTQDTVLTRSTPQDARTAGQPAARLVGERDPIPWRAVLTVVAVGVVALTVSLGVKLRTDATAGASLSMVAPAAKPSTPAPPQTSIPVDEATSAPSVAAAPAISASALPASNAAHTPRSRPSPSSHDPVRPKPVPTVSARDTIE